jgi:nucleoid DNA-binding protein
VDLDALVEVGRAVRVDLAWPDDGFGAHTDFFEEEVAPLMPGLDVLAEEPATLRVDVDGVLFRVDLAGSDAEESGSLDPLVVAAVDRVLREAGRGEGLVLVELDDCEGAVVRYERADPRAALQAVGLEAPPADGLHAISAGPTERAAFSFLRPADASLVAASLGGAAALDAGVVHVLSVLRAGKKVVCPGVGTVVLRTRSGRRGRDPLTGQVIQIPPVHSVQFKAGQSLKEALGAPGGWTPPAAGNPGQQLLQAVAQVLIGGEAAAVPGIGTWRATRTRERRGRNPATGQEIVIPGRVVVRFTVDPGLVAALTG